MDLLKAYLSLSFVLSLLLLGTSATLAAESRAGEVRTIEVVAEDFLFEPVTIEVSPGETIRLRLVNQGSLSHNLHVGGKDLQTETVQGGGSDTLTLEAPETGSLRFWCNVPGHRETGMKGELVIN